MDHKRKKILPISGGYLKADIYRRDIKEFRVFSSYMKRAHFRSVDAEDFTTIIGQVVTRYAITHEQIAKRFKVNLSTVYRWQKGRSTPGEIVRGVVVDWLIAQMSSREDELLSVLAGLNKGEVPDALAPAFRNHEEPGILAIYREGWPLNQILRAVPQNQGSLTLRRMLAWKSAEAKLEPHRPTFEVFEWEIAGSGPVTLTPEMVGRELCVVPLTAGVVVEIGGRKFETDRPAKAAKLAAVFCGSRESREDMPPLLPSVVVRKAGEASGLPLLRGLLILSCELGVASSGADERIALVPAAAEYVSRVNFSSCPTVSVPVNVGKHYMDDRAMLSPMDGPAKQEYNHSRSIEYDNFRIFHHENFVGYQQKFSNLENAVLFKYRVMDLEKSFNAPVHMRPHGGAEVLLPLSGAIECHFVASRALEGDPDGRLRSALADASAIGSPEILRACIDSDIGIGGINPDVTIFDPWRVAHGFTALTSRAKALSISVEDMDTSPEWIEFSQQSATRQSKGPVVAPGGAVS